MEGELWDLVETGRNNVNNNRVIYGSMNNELTEYYSHVLAEVVDGEKENDWILVIRYKIDK